VEAHENDVRAAERAVSIVVVTCRVACGQA